MICDLLRRSGSKEPNIIKTTTARTHSPYNIVDPVPKLVESILQIEQVWRVFKDHSCEEKLIVDLFE